LSVDVRYNYFGVSYEREEANMPEQTVTAEDVREVLKNVYDPEIPVNIVDLGLIYDVQVDESNIFVQMTLTAPGCGMGPMIAQQAEWAISELEGVEDVQVEMTFDPPWSPELITEDGKKLLGLD
jgi:metal-sulfur cluster biosynthetic enzyme